jgi:hypothetical protein
MTAKPLSLTAALLPIIVLIGLLTANVIFYGDNSLGGANQIALLLSGAVAAIIALWHGHRWTDLFDGVTNAISSALPALIILLMIGALAGTWMLSGVVPAMIYYGLDILNPPPFFSLPPAPSALSCLWPLAARGAQFATVGIALLGIGKALGMHEGMIAGAIISGAYFGDKMSPLSDTTNLAPAMGRNRPGDAYPPYGLDHWAVHRHYAAAVSHHRFRSEQDRCSSFCIAAARCYRFEVHHFTIPISCARGSYRHDSETGARCSCSFCRCTAWWAVRCSLPTSIVE